MKQINELRETMEKQHTIALLKLVGASSGMIGNLILTQSLLLAALGYAMGVGLEALIAPLFPRRVLVLPAELTHAQATAC